MYELLKAIQTRFTIARLSTTITGGLHLGQAPSGTVMPYAVVTSISSSPEFNTSKTYAQTCDIQFSLFAAGAASAALLGRTLRSTFNYQSLTLEQGKMVAAKLTNEHGPLLDPANETGNPVFHYILEFEFLQTQSLA